MGKRYYQMGMALGNSWVPYNLSNYWGADQDRRDFAIKHAMEAEQDRICEEIINSDLHTRFCRKVAQKLLKAFEAIRAVARERPLTRAEDNEADALLEKYRYYSKRFEYFLSKLDRSAVVEVSRHFWYYDDETGEVVDKDTGTRYKA